MTKYHYCLLLMGSLLLGSCQSVEQLSIDYMLPAEVSFPATLKRVAVVNNMPNVPDNKLIITEEEDVYKRQVEGDAAPVRCGLYQYGAPVPHYRCERTGRSKMCIRDRS